LDDHVTVQAPGQPDRAESVAGDVRSALVTALSLAVLGVPVAAIWYALAPRVLYRVSDGAGVPADFGTQGFIADDGWFFLLTAVAGVLTGVAAWAIGRRHAVGVAIGLGVGGIAAAIVTWKLGTSFGSGAYHTALDANGAGATTVRGPLTLGAKGCLVAWPIAALVGLIVGLAYESAGATRQSGRQPPLPPTAYGQPVPRRLPDDTG
jgi:hypothetical protein